MKEFPFFLFMVLLVTCNNDVIDLESETLWEKTYGETDRDEGRSVQQTSDGGFVIAGVTESFGAGECDVYVIRTNENGSIIWEKTYGGVNDDEGWSVCETSDGGFIFTGGTYSFGSGNSDVYLIKTDSKGDTLWTRTYGGTNYDIGYSVKQTKDGGFIIGGVIDLFGFYMIRISSTGDTLWSKRYGGLVGGEGRSIIQTNDGGFAFVGFTKVLNRDLDVHLIRTNSNGDSLWTKMYGDRKADAGYSIQQTSDGGFVIAGYTIPYDGTIDTGIVMDTGFSDVYLIRTNLIGDIIWTQTYSVVGDLGGFCVQQTSDEGFVIAGWNGFDAFFLADAYLIRTNSKGKMLWSKTYGGSENDKILSVQQTNDGGFVATGYTYSLGVGSSDLYLIRLGPEEDL